MKSKRRLGICLAVGILVLAVSAAAAFGSVNGYARYKQAVKDLLLRDNFTVQAQTHLSVDGERLLSVQMDYAKAGLNSAYHSREDHGGESHQEYRTVRDGVRTRFAGDSSFYSCESIERRPFPPSWAMMWTTRWSGAWWTSRRPRWIWCWAS